MARPRREIDKFIFENLCEIQCTQTEIASVLGVDFKTLQKWCKQEYDDEFSNVYKKKSENGKITLRRYQMKLAETSTAMAIFLGKQYLGQKDYIETNDTPKIEVANDIPRKDNDNGSI